MTKSMFLATVLALNVYAQQAPLKQEQTQEQQKEEKLTDIVPKPFFEIQDLRIHFLDNSLQSFT